MQVGKGLAMPIILIFFILSCTNEADKAQKALLDFDRTKTLGDAVKGSEYVSKVKWTHEKSKQNEIIVSALIDLNRDKLLSKCAEDIEKEPGFNFFNPLSQKKIKEELKAEIAKIKDVSILFKFSVAQDSKTPYLTKAEYIIASGSGKYEVKYGSTGQKDHKPDDLLVKLYRNEFPLLTYKELLLSPK